MLSDRFLYMFMTRLREKQQVPDKWDVQILGVWRSTCTSSLGDVHVLGSTCTSSLTDVHVLWVHVCILVGRCARSGSPRVRPQ